MTEEYRHDGDCPALMPSAYCAFKSFGWWIEQTEPSTVHQGDPRYSAILPWPRAVYIDSSLDLASLNAVTYCVNDAAFTAIIAATDSSFSLNFSYN